MKANRVSSMRSCCAAGCGRRTKSTAAVIAIACICGSHSSAQVRYEYVDIGYMEPERGDVYGVALNDRGAIVGFQNVSGRGSIGFIWRNGRFDELLGPNGTKFIPTDINDSNEIVGSSSIEYGEPPHAYLIRDNQHFDLGALDGSASYATSISNAGFIAGYAHDDPDEFGWSGDYEAARFTLDEIAFLGYVADGDDSRAEDINNNGIAVGSSSILRYRNQPRRACIMAADFMIALDDLGGDNSGANAVNDWNDAVGFADLRDGRAIATIWESALFPNGLGGFGGPTSIARDINNDGTYVGSSLLQDANLSEAFVGHNGFVYKLSELVIGNETPRFDNALAISESGQILAQDTIGEFPNHETHTYLLTPVASDDLVLDRIEPGRVGLNTLYIENATPGADVHLVIGSRSGMRRVPGCPDLRLGINPVLTVLRKQAFSDGTVWFHVDVPVKFSDRSFVFQAVERSSCRVSPAGFVFFDRP